MARRMLQSSTSPNDYREKPKLIVLKVMRNNFRSGNKVIKKAQYRNIVIPQLN